MPTTTLEKQEAENEASRKNVQALRDELSDARNQIDAIGAAQAVIEFEPDGTIVTANDNTANNSKPRTIKNL